MRDSDEAAPASQPSQAARTAGGELSRQRRPDRKVERPEQAKRPGCLKPRARAEQENVLANIEDAFMFPTYLFDGGQIERVSSLLCNGRARCIVVENTCRMNKVFFRARQMPGTVSGSLEGGHGQPFEICLHSSRDCACLLRQ